MKKFIILALLLFTTLAQAQAVTSGKPIASYINPNGYAVAIYYVGIGGQGGTVLFLRLASEDTTLAILDPIPVYKGAFDKCWKKDFDSAKLTICPSGNDVTVTCVGCQ